MARVLVLCVCVASLSAQQPNRKEFKLEILPGAKVSRIVVPMDKAPEAADRFALYVSTDKIRTVLFLPDGRQFDSASSAETEVMWHSTPFSPPLGSADGGHAISIRFSRPAQAGRYVFQFDAAETKVGSHVSVQFVSDREEHEMDMQSIPGYQTAGPAEWNGTAPLVLTLARERKGGILDVVVTDPAANLSLTLPGGRVLDTLEGKEAGLQWKTLKEGESIDPPGAMFGIGGMLLRQPGRHRVFFFEIAPPGRYEIRVSGGEGIRGEVTAALIPLSEMFERDAAGPRQPVVPPDTVQLQPYSLPQERLYLGDPVKIMVGVLGASGIPKFKVQVEYRLEQGNPFLENVEVAFTKTSEGPYVGTFVPNRFGQIRVGLEVSGKTSQGKAFVERTVTTEVTIHRLAARFLSLTEKAIPRAETGQLDGLEITATLDVLLAGTYAMSLTVDEGQQSGQMVSGHSERLLARGKQTLVVIVPATELRRFLKNGPWTISRLQINRPAGNSFGDFIATGDFTMKTAAYKREQWYRGEAFSDETVTAHGVYPATSGRFRMVEVEWGVTTPGGSCNWSGDLTRGNSSRSVVGFGVLPKGRAILKFVFDGAMVAAEREPDWTFTTFIACESFSLADDHAEYIKKVSLNPAHFEQQTASFRVAAQSMIQLRRGEGSIALIDIHGKPREKPAARIGATDLGILFSEPKFGTDAPWGPQFSVGLTAGRDAKLGRHFIPISVTAGDETATSALVVEVIQ